MRTALFFMIAISALEGIWWIVLPLALIYLYRHPGYELVVIALLIDGYVGAFYAIPYYSIATVVVVLLANWARPRVLLYTR